MTLITATQPDRPMLFFHSFGIDGQIHFTQGAEKAHHFRSFDEAHTLRESREFWAGLEASDFTTVAIGITSEADPEYRARIDADRCTWQFKQAGRNVDSGRKPITDSPLFGGPAQGDLFGASSGEATK